MIRDISTLQQLDDFAKEFSTTLKAGDIVYLNGDLGSGKTSFVQMVLKHLGYVGRVKSPTYAIYEEYQVHKQTIVHLDLYRLSDAQELYYLGIEEIITNKTIAFIEWPAKGAGVLLPASKTLAFQLLDSIKRELVLDIT